MTVSTANKDDLLQTLASSIATVGLFDGDREIKDVRYERLPVEFGEPQTEFDAEGRDTGFRFIENVNELRFQDMGKDHRIDHFGLFDLAGDLAAFFALLRPHDPLPADDIGVFRVGSIKVGIP